MTNSGDGTTTVAEIDVVILTWNDGELLDAAVQSVLHGCEGIDIRVIVVDNASEPPAVVTDDPRVQLVRNETNRGVAGGRNDGIVRATAALVCFLDSDAELAADSLAAMRAPLDRDAEIGIVVPVFVDQEPNASAGKKPTLRLKLDRMRGKTAVYEAMPAAAGADEWDVDFGIGACQLFRRSVFDAVGGLDERMYWVDDADFCLRVRAAGFRVVQIGTTRVLHPPRRRFRRPASWKGVRHGAALARFLVRHRGV